MAARFWTYVFGWQTAVALALGWLAARLTSASALGFGFEALLAWWLLLVIGEALCFALAHHYRSSPSARPPPGRARGFWRAFATELAYFAATWFAMMLAPLGQGRRAAATRAGGAPRAASMTPQPILLLHGFSCNAAVWAPLRRRLEAAHIGPVTAPDLEPLGADLDSYLPCAMRALQSLERATSRAPVTLIGHSSGGLVARALLRQIEPRRIRQLITVGTPHHGTVLARCISGRQARQLRPGSTWLHALNSVQDGALPVPTLCIYSLDDNIVTPPESAVLRGAQRLELDGLGHFGLLHASAAFALIEVSLSSSLGGPR